ncbi:MAG: aspartate-semialdehyde dehydrogenase [Bdellovibrionia bacterium]
MSESKTQVRQSKVGYRVAVVGATGAVGRELLSVLASRKFPISQLILFSSKRSEGQVILWREKSHRCQVLQKGCFQGVDFAFFDASDEVSRQWVPEAAESGAWVIDNSATFRMKNDVPLLVPEVNAELLADRLRNPSALSASERILSGPNCSTVELVLALKPISDRWGLKRVVVSTYQSVSGAGSAAMRELSSQTLALFNQQSVEPQVFAHPIAFNCIPQIGGFKENGYTSEEQKIMEESRKILGLPQLKISATAVRVPTFSCHGESVNVECEREFDLEEVREALRAQSGVIVQDDPEKKIYPLSVTSEQEEGVEAATGRDAVYVGRIRRDQSVPFGVNFWVVSDNLRKGAALNAVQIAESILVGVR